MQRKVKDILPKTFEELKALSQDDRARLWARLGVPGEGTVDILNVKCDPGLYSLLDKRDGILRGYHMGGTWVSIMLDGSIELSQIYALMRSSYDLVGPRKKLTK